MFPSSQNSRSSSFSSPTSSPELKSQLSSSPVVIVPSIPNEIQEPIQTMPSSKELNERLLKIIEEGAIPAARKDHFLAQSDQQKWALIQMLEKAQQMEKVFLIARLFFSHPITFYSPKILQNISFTQ